MRITFVAILVCVLLSGCLGGDESLHAVPSTFSGALEVQPLGRETKSLYDALYKLGENYGLTTYGDGATNDINWQIQVFCRSHPLGGANTTESGELILFDISIYGFKRVEDYEHYKSEMLATMAPYGTLSDLIDRPQLTREELLKREPYMKVDLTSQCENEATKGVTL